MNRRGRKEGRVMERREINTQRSRQNKHLAKRKLNIVLDWGTDTSLKCVYMFISKPRNKETDKVQRLQGETEWREKSQRIKKMS